VTTLLGGLSASVAAAALPSAKSGAIAAGGAAAAAGLSSGAIGGVVAAVLVIVAVVAVRAWVVARARTRTLAASSSEGLKSAWSAAQARSGERAAAPRQRIAFGSPLDAAAGAHANASANPLWAHPRGADSNELASDFERTNPMREGGAATPANVFERTNPMRESGAATPGRSRVHASAPSAMSLRSPVEAAAAGLNLGDFRRDGVGGFGGDGDAVFEVASPGVLPAMTNNPMRAFAPEPPRGGRLNRAQLPLTVDEGADPGGAPSLNVAQ